jgi:hypothetical protein
MVRPHTWDPPRGHAQVVVSLNQKLPALATAPAALEESSEAGVRVVVYRGSSRQPPWGRRSRWWMSTLSSTSSACLYSLPSTPLHHTLIHNVQPQHRECTPRIHSPCTV